jgi:pyridoxine 4-dehydrogenase
MAAERDRERRELGGSIALGPWHVRRTGYGAMQLAGDGVFGPPRDRDEALLAAQAVRLGATPVTSN